MWALLSVGASAWLKAIPESFRAARPKESVKIEIGKQMDDLVCCTDAEQGFAAVYKSLEAPGDQYLLRPSIR
jgi:hypothetical protein